MRRGFEEFCLSFFFFGFIFFFLFICTTDDLMLREREQRLSISDKKIVLEEWCQKGLTLREKDEGTIYLERRGKKKETLQAVFCFCFFFGNGLFPSSFYSAAAVAAAAVPAEAEARRLLCRRLSIATRLRAPPKNLSSFPSSSPLPPSLSSSSSEEDEESSEAAAASSPEARLFPAARCLLDEAWRIPESEAGAPPLAQAWKRDERFPR